MARVTKPLTNTEVDKAKPKEKDYSLMDGQGLFLRVKSNGSKSWLFNYYRPFTEPPKRTNLGIGSYPEISLAQARAKRDEYRALLAQNIDPQAYRQSVVDEEVSKRENTLKSVAEKWREKKSLEVQSKTMEKNWARLENHLFHKLGNTPISEISPRMVIQAIEPLKARGVGDTLHRVIRLLNEVLNFAVNGGVIEFNKCLKVAENYPTAQTENNPTIRPEKLPEFLADLRDSNHAFNA